MVLKDNKRIGLLEKPFAKIPIYSFKLSEDEFCDLWLKILIANISSMPRIELRVFTERGVAIIIIT